MRLMLCVSTFLPKENVPVSSSHCFIVSSLPCSAISRYSSSVFAQTEPHVAVIVMGDIGRSPRMQYHSLSLTQTPFANLNTNKPPILPIVHLIGLPGSDPHPSVQNNPNIRLWHLKDFSEATLTYETSNHHPAFSSINRLLNILPATLRRVGYMALKVILQINNIQSLLLSIPVCNTVLVQNPPGIPLIFICRLYCWLSGAKLVIDWHNFGFSIMALGPVGSRSPFLVSFAKAMEIFSGRIADAHLCVTEAMSSFMRRKWGIQATAVHDHPPSIFREARKASSVVIHSILLRMKSEGVLRGVSKEFLQRYDITDFNDKTFATVGSPQVLQAQLPSLPVLSSHKVPQPPSGPPPVSSSSLTTPRNASEPIFRTCRPALFVSSTSWTPDEDFQLLFSSLLAVEEHLQKVENARLPDVLVIITGKGPMKAAFEEQVAKANLSRVQIATAWLRAEDYPFLLSCCDAGISLHTSSSGLDLPMKVVDMLGVGLPVLAVKFHCISELVQHGINGFVFEDSGQLIEQIMTVLDGLVSDGDVLNPEEYIRCKEADAMIEMKTSLQPSHQSKHILRCYAIHREAENQKRLNSSTEKSSDIEIPEKEENVSIRNRFDKEEMNAYERESNESDETDSGDFDGVYESPLRRFRQYLDRTADDRDWTKNWNKTAKIVFQKL